jgi:methionine synthase II (cobalamin-independent)
VPTIASQTRTKKRADLQKAFADYDAGIITRNDLVAAQDKAAKDSVERMEAAGETYVTDGEQRASS